ncbi:hypothetical protein ACN9MB_09035 [Dyella kyungheensis]|uniref:hypothetical protein n=1 Tax=Dyella kyungheensis TaxID=1242174 RepID=UPI003CF1CF2E
MANSDWLTLKGGNHELHCGEGRKLRIIQTKRQPQQWTAVAVLTRSQAIGRYATKEEAQQAAEAWAAEAWGHKR